VQALPVVGQLDGRLRLSPQRLGGDKAIEGKGVFPREPGVHSPGQLLGQHGQRLGCAVCVFEFGKILLAQLVLASDENSRFGKRPAPGHVADLLA